MSGQRLIQQTTEDDVRLTEDETRQVIALWSEREAGGGSSVTDPRARIADLAAGLGISEQEARRLVMEVRRRKADEEQAAQTARLEQLARERQALEQRIRETEAERIRIEEETRLAKARRRLAEEERLRLEAERQLHDHALGIAAPNEVEPRTVGTTGNVKTDDSKLLARLLMVILAIIYLAVMMSLRSFPTSPAPARWMQPEPGWQQVEGARPGTFIRIQPPPGMRQMEGAPPGTFVPQNQDRPLYRR